MEMIITISKYNYNIPASQYYEYVYFVHVMKGAVVFDDLWVQL